MRFWKLVGRALKLRCPVCGQGQLFRGLFSMHEACPACGLKLEREPGFFLGAIYFNYGITALLVLVTYAGLRFFVGLNSQQTLFTTVALSVIFPVFFFRFARSLWLGFDQYHDPRDGETTA